MADVGDALVRALHAVAESAGRGAWSDATRLRRELDAHLAGVTGLNGEIVHAAIAAGGLGVPGRLASGVDPASQVSLVSNAAGCSPAVAADAVAVWCAVVAAPAHESTAVPTVPLGGVAAHADSPAAGRIGKAPGRARPAWLVVVAAAIVVAVVAIWLGVNRGGGSDAGPATSTSAATSSAGVPATTSSAPPTTSTAGGPAPTSTAPGPTTLPVPTGDYVAVAPVRLLDTRTGVGTPGGRKGPENLATASIAGRTGPLPAAAIKAAVLNVTVAEPGQAGYLTVFATDSRPYDVSHLAFGPGGAQSSMVVTRANPAGSIDLRFSEGVTGHVIVDLLGSTSISMLMPGCSTVNGTVAFHDAEVSDSSIAVGTDAPGAVIEIVLIKIAPL